MFSFFVSGDAVGVSCFVVGVVLCLFYGVFKVLGFRGLAELVIVVGVGGG